MSDLQGFLEENALGHLLQGMIDEEVTLDLLLSCTDTELSSFTKKIGDKIKLRIALDKLRHLSDESQSASQPVSLPVRVRELKTVVHLEDLPLLLHDQELPLTPGQIESSTPQPASALPVPINFSVTGDSDELNSTGQELNDQDFDILKTLDFLNLGKETGKSLRQLLQSVTFGKILLEKAEKGEELKSKDRSYLVKLIVESELRALKDVTTTIRKDVWQHWANEVVSLFKGEKTDIYYIPYRVDGGQLIQASGMISNRLITHRRLLSTTTKKRNSSTSSKSSDSSVSSENTCKRVRPLPETFKSSLDKNPSARDCLDWLRGSSTPEDLVAEKWLATFELRNKILSEGLSYKQYFASYPALTLPDGHKLLSLDFQTIYPNADNVYDESFPIVKTRLLNLLAEKGESTRVDQTTLDLLQLATVGEEQASLAAFLAIVSLLRQMPTISMAKKKLWKLSREEVRSSFIGLVASVSNIERYCADRETLVAAKGIPEQPYILAVGSSWSTVSQYEVIVHTGHRYQFTNISTAIRKAYHIYWALDLAYPKDSAVCWMFVQRALFNMKSKYDTEGVPLRELLNNINS